MLGLYLNYKSRKDQTEEDQTGLKNHLAQLEKQRDEARKTIRRERGQVFQNTFIARRAVEGDVEEKRKEVKKYIQELKDTALQMSEILEDIFMLKSPPY